MWPPVSNANISESLTKFLLKLLSHKVSHKACLSEMSSCPTTNLSCLCPSLSAQSMEDLEDQKRKKKKEKMTLGSLSRVFARGKQRKSLDPGLFDGTAAPDYYIEEDADW